MQALNWNDLRYVLAISRKERLAEAARFLGVDDTTVSRRLGALQIALGRRLYQRLSDGRLELTEAGEALAAIAGRMEQDLGALVTPPSSDGGVSGVVRLTSVPFIINRVLAPTANQLLNQHPKLRVELVAEARDLSLTRREADMALRLSRPQSGGMRVKARRVEGLRYAPYAAASHDKMGAASLPWVTYEETMAHLPQARWMAAMVRKDSGQAAPLKVNDTEAAFEAVAAGYGQSLLPCLVADRDPRLRRTKPSKSPDYPVRELWLLVHSELRNLDRIQAITKWVGEVFSKQAKPG
ncbi:LysR family transcriptional regulator [Pelagibius litoralis]|uniref:LysR family transcriptional regulator n=1 Tax=Pelagibius litoralis TaxID=374515 RepID=A0A967CCL5_9PROT|nr:LysR family transcriptional regulator [Pelagibius litoralis]NIA69134.1 LysR family transcriptional regulator [Pelagibius litoralis]